MGPKKDKEITTWNDIVRSEIPLDWRRISKELSFTKEEILSGKKKMIPDWETIKKLLDEN